MSGVDPGFIGRAQLRLGQALGQKDFHILSAKQISGNGLSRSVYVLTSTSSDQPGESHSVLLLEQASSPALEPNRDAEYAVLRALADVPGVPVASALWLESDAAPLGAPFLLTTLLPGTTDPKRLLGGDYVADPRTVIRESFEVLGRLAALDVSSVELGRAFSVPSLADAWEVQLSKCEQTIRDCGGSDLVVTAAALRRLRREPPPAPRKLAIVHGDYRLGNYLFDRSGLTGVIDWEMVHLGDAMEDLAWSFLPLWEFNALPGRVGGCLSREEAQAAWERASGQVVDPVALRWWLLYSHIKALSIWLTARHDFASSRAKGVLPALVGYAMVEKQELQMIELLRDGQ